MFEEPDSPQFGEFPVLSVSAPGLQIFQSFCLCYRRFFFISLCQGKIGFFSVNFRLQYLYFFILFSSILTPFFSFFCTSLCFFSLFFLPFSFFHFFELFSRHRGPSLFFSYFISYFSIFSSHRLLCSFDMLCALLMFCCRCAL